MHSISIVKLPCISNLNNTTINSIKQLYLKSFSKPERREWQQLIDLHNKKKIFNLFEIKYNEKFIGFISLWLFDIFTYVEHFAIEDNFKNKGFGSQTLQILIQKIKKSIVLEVELPTNEQSIKRINFYQKNGFHLLDNDYLQPPYSKNLPAVEMKIMTTNNKLSFSLIQQTLYEMVYNK